MFFAMLRAHSFAEAHSMNVIHPGITGRAIEPLLVRPREAWKMLGCGNTHGYELLNTGELDSFLDGKARKIVVASIHRYIARKLAPASPIGSPTNPASQSRRRSRSRKTVAHQVRS